MSANLEFSKMLAVSLLIFMNGNSKVEEVVTLSRYVFMEGFNSVPSLPKPHKMLRRYQLCFEAVCKLGLQRN